MSIREEFENWYRKNHVWPPEADPLEKDGGEYVFGPVRYRWQAWQASRAAVEVKLPIIKSSEWACSSDECEYIRQGITMSKYAINAAGIKVKP